MTTITLRERIDELIAQHGTLRATARVLMTDCGYLHRLRSGEKTEPGDPLLRRMGLREVTRYERVSSTTAQGDGGTAGAQASAAVQRHITDMLVAHRDMIEAQQRGDGEAEVLAVRRMEAARSAVAGQTPRGVEQTEPFWCHEQSHDRPRCEAQCAECAEDGVPVSQESNVVETLRLARLALRNATAPVGNHSARTLIGEALMALDRAIAGVKGLDDAQR